MLNIFIVTGMNDRETLKYLWKPDVAPCLRRKELRKCRDGTSDRGPGTSSLSVSDDRVIGACRVRRSRPEEKW